MCRLLTVLLFVLTLLPFGGGAESTLLTVEGRGVLSGDTLRLARVLYGDTIASIPVVRDGEADALIEIAGPDTLLLYSSKEVWRLRPVALRGGHARARL